MRAFIKSIAVAACLCSNAGAAAAQTTVGGATLFQNVHIYDGTGRSLSASSNVLVRGNRIERISREPIPVERRPDSVRDLSVVDPLHALARRRTQALYDALLARRRAR